MKKLFICKTIFSDESMLFLLFFYRIKEIKFHAVGKIWEGVTSDIEQKVNYQ